MIIGFDAKRANTNATGLGNYSRYIVNALAKYYPDNEYRMYTPKFKENAQYNLLLSDHACVTSCLPQSAYHRGIFSSWWRTCGIGRDLSRDAVDIFHGLSGEIPISSSNRAFKSVVTIHDLIFLVYPNLYKPIDRWIYNLKFKYACQKADRIIAVSECTKRDIVKFYGCDPSKIDVIYQGCSDSFATIYTPEQRQEVCKKYDLPEKFLLNVGTLESRKNLMLCVKALEHLDDDISLVACGRRTPYSDEVLNYAVQRGIASRVKLIHDVPFRDLPIIYQSAEVFLYPSFYEGFGIPIIEALSCQIPVVAATGSCLEEAGGDAALYVDPNDDRAMAEAIKRFMSDKEFRQQRVVSGLKHVAQFLPEPIANSIMDCYARVVG